MLRELREIIRTVLDLREPLGFNVHHGRSGVFSSGSEADEEHISHGIRQRTQAVIVRAACCIPKTHTERCAVNLDVGGEVILKNRQSATTPGLNTEHRRNIFSGE